MITLSRTQARRLRAVFRRSAFGLSRRGPVAPLLLDVVGDQLHFRHIQAHLAVEYAAPLTGPSSGSITLPLDALVDIEGGDHSVVTLESIIGNRTVARWTDRGTGQSREYVVTPVAANTSFPDLPETWADPGPCFVDALARATTIAGEPDSRYDLGCLLLKTGPHGHEVVATDGRQALIQGAFRFPWDGDVLIRSSPLFASRDLPRDQPWSVGRAGDHVVLRSGPWTIALTVQAHARFPRVDLAFPDPATVTARLRLDPTEARVLSAALDHLPGHDRVVAPATLDLNGHVAVRVRGDGDGPATEIILPRSSYSGTPVRLAICRTHLGRAAELGFGEVEVVDAASPLVCRSGGWAYAWQPLDPEVVLLPSESDVRAEIEPASPKGSEPAPAPTPPATDHFSPSAAVRATSSSSTRSTPIDPPTPIDSTDPVAEAEALHALLADAHARVRRLVAALRRQRRRDRQVRATLDSLRQIRLPDAVR